jgi:hypothetical protein
MYIRIRHAILAVCRLELPNTPVAFGSLSGCRRRYVIIIVLSIVLVHISCIVVSSRWGPREINRPTCVSFTIMLKGVWSGK